MVLTFVEYGAVFLVSGSFDSAPSPPLLSHFVFGTNPAPAPSLVTAVIGPDTPRISAAVDTIELDAWHPERYRRCSRRSPTYRLHR